MKRPLIILAAVAVAAALVIGILQTRGTDEAPDATVPSSTATDRALAGAPPALAALHADANALLPGDQLEARLESLRGHPVVVNVWGSWCTPCREEFPLFQEASVKYGKRVAFLGLATQDSKEGASAFLADNPVSYPSYLDFDGALADEYGVLGAPATIYYDAEGKRTYFHQGKYVTAEDFEADIERYAGA